MKFVVITMVLFLSTSTAPGFLNYADRLPIEYPSPAYCGDLGVYFAFAVPIESEPGSITVVVFAVMHNSIGQTLDISTATFTLVQGQSETAYPIITLAYGNYSATVFVWTTTGAAIAPPQIFNTSC
jgi:hypothetical protein